MVDFNLQDSYQANGKLNFDISGMEQFSIRRGAHVSWEKSFLCPCRQSSGIPDSNCPFCHGMGFSFLPPKDTQISLQSMGRNTQNTQAGVSFSGTALGTTTMDDAPEIGFRDRISFRDSPIAESLLVKVSPKDVTHGIFLKYDILSIDYIVAGPKLDVVPVNSLKFEDNRLYPTDDLVGLYLSINVKVVLRFYVVDYIREGRYQYKDDPRFSSSKEGFTTLPRLLLLRREDMYIPSVINEDNKATPISKDPKVSLVDDPEIGGFYQ